MKKKVVRKLMALALVSAMATSMLAGCGSSDDSGKDSGKDADKGSEETVLKVAAFEGGNGTQIWEDIAKAFEESHDGVKVELEMSPELDKDLTKAIQNGDVPDVVYYNLGQPSGFTETMLKEEAIADISDVFDDELKDKMLDGILDGTDAQPYGDGKIYLAPIFYTPTGFWYNATLVGEGNSTRSRQHGMSSSHLASRLRKTDMHSLHSLQQDTLMLQSMQCSHRQADLISTMMH